MVTVTIPITQWLPLLLLAALLRLLPDSEPEDRGLDRRDLALMLACGVGLSALCHGWLAAFWLVGWLAGECVGSHVWVEEQPAPLQGR